MASAAFHNHVLVFFKIHICLVDVVQHRDWDQFCWSAARFGHLGRMIQVYQRLDDRMVGGVHVCIEREVTFATAVVRSIAFRCNNPFMPLQIFEANVQLLNPAALVLVVRLVILERVPMFGFAGFALARRLTTLIAC